MAVHAHPDDETITMGGTLAHYAATNSIARGESTDVIVVTGTRGELGEIVIPERDTPDEHERLGETRMERLPRRCVPSVYSDGRTLAIATPVWRGVKRMPIHAASTSTSALISTQQPNHWCA